MAHHFVPQVNFGARAADASGEGLNFLAQDIIQRKTQERQMALQHQEQERMRSQREMGLAQMFGPEQARAYSNLPDTLLGPIVKQHLAGPSQQANAAALGSILKGQPVTDLSGVNENQAYRLAQLQLQQRQTQDAAAARAATQQTNEEIKKTNQQISQQKQIDSANKPYVERLSKAVPFAENMKSVASKMLELLDGGQVSTGIGSLLPGMLQNDATQQYDAYSKELATLIAGNSGAATNFKIKTAQEYKPNIYQNPKVQRALTLDFIDKANEILQREQIKDDLVIQNGGNQPANLESKISKELKVYKSLPEPTSEGEVRRNKKTGDVFRVENGQWRRIFNEEQ